MTARVFVDVEPDPSGTLKGTGLHEDFDLGLSIVDGEVGFDLILGVDKKVGNLTVDQFLNGSCALTTVRAVNVTSLPAVVTLTDLFLRPVGMGGGNSLEADLDALIDGLLSLFVGDYNRLVTDSVYGILQGPARSLINGILRGVDLSNAECPGRAERNETLFELDSSSVIAAAAGYVNDVVGVDGANGALQCAIEVVEESGALSGTVFSTTLPSGINIDIKDLGLLSPPGSLYDLEVLDPYGDDHYHLSNEVGLASCGRDNIYDPACDGLRARVTVDVVHEEKGINDQVNLTVSLGDLWATMGVKAAFDTAHFGGLEMAQLGNIGCVASSFKDIGLADDDLTLGAFGVDVSAILTNNRKVSVHGIGRLSPRFFRQPLSNNPLFYDMQPTKRIDDTFNSSRLTLAVGMALKGGLGMLTDAANEYADYAVYAAPYVCSGDPIPAPPSPSPTGGSVPLWKSGIAMVAYGSAFVLGLFVWAQKYRGWSPHRKGVSYDKADDSKDNDALNYAFSDGVGLLDRAGGSSIAEEEKVSTWQVARRRVISHLTYQSLSCFPPRSSISLATRRGQATRLTGTTPSCSLRISPPGYGSPCPSLSVAP